jgi:hypothetical protein
MLARQDHRGLAATTQAVAQIDESAMGARDLLTDRQA